MIATELSTYYESDEQLRQYLEFHYGPEYFGVNNYPQQCAEICLDALTKLHGASLQDLKGLELGCAVGRCAFELAAHLGKIVAVDLSSQFVSTAIRLQEEGSLAYTIDREGDLRDTRSIDLRTLGLDETRKNITFQADDACHFTWDSTFDLVFAGNLLDRLHSPATFLRRLPQFMNKSGLLAISSPYTLKEEFTPREEWLGGYLHEGREVSVFQQMREILESEGFQLFQPPQDVPFVIRETARKYQHTLAEMSLWIYQG